MPPAGFLRGPQGQPTQTVNLTGVHIWLIADAHVSSSGPDDVGKREQLLHSSLPGAKEVEAAGEP